MAFTGTSLVVTFEFFDILFVQNLRINRYNIFA